jgi:hypothetical protein
MRRAQQQTVTFQAYDSAFSTGVTKSGLTLLASDVKISKDGGAFASATNPPVEIGATGRYSLVLTADETNCGWFHAYIEKAGMRPADIVGSMDSHPAAAVVDDAANSATTFVTNLPSATDDFYAHAGVRFNSGALAGQVREIESYDGATKAVTLAVALTAEPAAGDLFELVDS